MQNGYLSSPFFNEVVVEVFDLAVLVDLVEQVAHSLVVDVANDHFKVQHAPWHLLMSRGLAPSSLRSCTHWSIVSTAA